jgi:hypothetical protein
MLKPESAELHINNTTELPLDTLIDVIDLLATNCFSLEPETAALEHLNGSAKL